MVDPVLVAVGRRSLTDLLFTGCAVAGQSAGQSEEISVETLAAALPQLSLVESVELVEVLGVLVSTLLPPRAFDAC